MFDSKRNKKQKGFTLVELIVVIAIIGLLGSILMVSVGTIRVRTRDTKRAQDIRGIQQAVELYFATNGHYPIYPTAFNMYYDSPQTIGSSEPGWRNTFGADLSEYIKEMPVPIRVGGTFGPAYDYFYFSGISSDTHHYGFYDLEECTGYKIMDGYYIWSTLEQPGGIADYGVDDVSYELYGGKLEHYNPCLESW